MMRPCQRLLTRMENQFGEVLALLSIICPHGSANFKNQCSKNKQDCTVFSNRFLLKIKQCCLLETKIQHQREAVVKVIPLGLQKLLKPL